MNIWAIDGTYVASGYRSHDGLFRYTHQRGAGGMNPPGRRIRPRRFTDRDEAKARHELMAYDLDVESRNWEVNP